MERMRTIPVDLILHELVTRLAELPDTQHRDLHRAISNGCIRPQILAEEWTHGAGAAQQAAWLVRRLDGDIGKPASLPVTAGPGMSVVPTGQMVAAETRAMEVAVARRLADCALSLLVTQDAEDAATAQTLLQAAQRVVGLPAAFSARLIDSKGQRLKVARECLPSGVDIIACLRDNKPTTYKASNTGEECDAPEAAVRAAWERHLRPTQSVPDRAFKVGDRVKFIGHAGGRMFQHGPVVGGEGTIKDIDIEDGGACPIWVDDVQCKNGGSDGWWFASAELDLVTPTA